MKKRERTCIRCGKVEVTFSKAEVCHACHWEVKQAKAAENEKSTLVGLGYEEIDGPVFQQTLHRSWSFVHPDCGTQQTWRFGNILKQLKLRPDSTPCSHCGGKERIKPAMAAFIEKYGRDFDVTLWEEYSTKVRRLTEKTYQKHKHEINPLNLKRGVHTYHLDHKMPIIEGFLQGIPAEQIAAKENLQILCQRLTTSAKVEVCNVESSLPRFLAPFQQ